MPLSLETYIKFNKFGFCLPDDDDNLFLSQENVVDHFIPLGICCYKLNEIRNDSIGITGSNIQTTICIQLTFDYRRKTVKTSKHTLTLNQITLDDTTFNSFILDHSLVTETIFIQAAKSIGISKESLYDFSLNGMLRLL